MRVHTKEKLYSCEICNKGFSDKIYLLKHIWIHTKEKLDICDICKKSFSQKYNPVVHLRVHAKEKPCSYKICNKHFSGKSVLVDQSAEHAEDKPFMFGFQKNLISKLYSSTTHESTCKGSMCLRILQEIWLGDYVQVCKVRVKEALSGKERILWCT